MTLFAALSVAASTPVHAQNSPGPQPIPLPPPIATPADVAYPGTLSLLVDLTDVVHRVAEVHETVPVAAGPLTLLYPQWIPGTHSPTGPISKMAGLVVTANGKRLEWVRDPVNVYAYHIDVPQGVKTLDVNFQYLAPVKKGEGRISFSSNFVDLSWNTVVLYPAGYFSRRIQYSPSIKLPEGWKYATALETKSQKGNLVHFDDTPLNKLVDSPLYAGVNFKRVDLSTDSSNKVYLDVFADTPAELEITPEELQLHRNMVLEARKLFASHHYDHYDFLFSVSDIIGGEGLEHHQSSEDGTVANYFTDWAAGVQRRDLLAHEYTHSWDGKFRRPAGLWTPNFDVPMQDELLWVYEGMTQYYGNVLTARAGMRTPEQARDLLAGVAATFETSPGRKWRPMVDTTNQPTVSQRTPVSWVSWQRPEDYYTEGMLIWLDADTKIRELSNGQKSLDDFAKLFYGVDNGSYITETYTFNDLVTALNTVQPYDWANFLKTRVYDLHPEVPENGFTQGGYKLVYNDHQPEWMKHGDNPRGTSFATSLGFSVMGNGELGSVAWDGPAFKAGITPDMQLVGVNDQTFSVAALRDAILSAEKDKSPIKLLLKRDDQLQTVSLDYHGGLRYPHLERVEGTEDRLDPILSPSK
ncbi:putative metalloprotease with PDZ domain [Silvibacterium bohemicum]|uniref:Putative metalloprotease with PDZ domain n=1 Tax=Silvibacterium bohemicum TaxID=1577686 RepID=A0A841JWX1_9BACT|nr:M61 family metallopeptidase [Silvibacterium bohemicum]MBB6144219.1 putative metalloprotease with PDZ domain [Silvibacterium bohemicum]